MIDLEKAKLEQLTSVDYTPDTPPSYVYTLQESCSNPNPSTVKRRRLRRCLRHLLAFSLFCLLAAYVSINTIFRVSRGFVVLVVNIDLPNIVNLRTTYCAKYMRAPRNAKRYSA